MPGDLRGFSTPPQPSPCAQSRIRISCIGVEQLLAIDRVLGDRFLARRRDDPVDELLPERLLDARMRYRIDEHHAVLVEEALVVFDQDREIAAIPECEPGPAIGEDVRVHRRRSVERRTHALSRVAIPGALDFVDVDSGGLPQRELGHVRSAAIAARYEWRAGGLEFLQRDDDVLAAADLRRIALRADE